MFLTRKPAVEDKRERGRRLQLANICQVVLEQESFQMIVGAGSPTQGRQPTQANTLGCLSCLPAVGKEKKLTLAN